MPNRIIKESICTSETLASISPEAERLWWRLVVQADDYGTYDARPRTVLGKCLTSLIGQVTEEDVERWLAELEEAGLIHRYVVDGRPYLEIATWSQHQRPPRAKKPKFPRSLSSDSTCGQMTDDADSRGQATAHAPVIRDSGFEIREAGGGNRSADASDVSRPQTAAAAAGAAATCSSDDDQPIEGPLLPSEPVRQFLEANLPNLLTPVVLDDAARWERELSTESVLCALEETVVSGKASWRYAQGVLRRYRAQRLTTRAAILAAEAHRQRASPLARQAPAGIDRDRVARDVERTLSIVEEVRRRAQGPAG